MLVFCPFSSFLRNTMEFAVQPAVADFLLHYRCFVSAFACFPCVWTRRCALLEYFSTGFCPVLCTQDKKKKKRMYRRIRGRTRKSLSQLTRNVVYICQKKKKVKDKKKKNDRKEVFFTKQKNRQFFSSQLLLFFPFSFSCTILFSQTPKKKKRNYFI